MLTTCLAESDARRSRNHQPSDGLYWIRVWDRDGMLAQTIPTLVPYPIRILACDWLGLDGLAWAPLGSHGHMRPVESGFRGPMTFLDLLGSILHKEMPTTFFLNSQQNFGFLFSEPDLLIRKQIKYPDPCYPLRKTLLCRHVRVSARIMAPKNNFFICCSATLRIRAKLGLRKIT